VITRRSAAGSPSANAAVLRRHFVRHVHELLYRGYQRLTTSQYQSAAEEEITGDLKDAIDTVLDERPESWMIHYFSSEEVPVSDRKRKGKKRKKIDIQIVSSRFSPRARFAFEAKRLGRKHPVSVYLGIEGLGRFIGGDYAADCDEAGMLGYVQSGSTDEWSAKLAADFASNAADLGANPNGIAPCQIVAELLHTFQSLHTRRSAERQIQIYHSLLLFH